MCASSVQALALLRFAHCLKEGRGLCVAATIAKSPLPHERDELMHLTMHGPEAPSPRSLGDERFFGGAPRDSSRQGVGERDAAAKAEQKLYYYAKARLERLADEADLISMNGKIIPVKAALENLRKEDPTRVKVAYHDILDAPNDTRSLMREHHAEAQAPLEVR